MPKDWTRHKAEITRLYIVEGKILKEVREILDIKYNFRASIRAYRMRIDEWALRKYKSRDDALDGEDEDMNKHIPTSGTEFSSPGASITRDSVQIDSNISIATKSSSVTDMMALIQDPAASSYALEVLLTKWQSGGQCLELLTTLLGTHRYCQYIARCTKEGRPVLFALIEAFIPIEEQSQVAKLLMEALLPARYALTKPDVAWFGMWNSACQCSDWDSFREALQDGGIVSSIAGELFERATSIVFAERLARRYIRRIQRFRAQTEWLSDLEKTEVEECRHNLVEVLENTRGDNLTLGRPVYKYSPEVLELDIDGAVTQEQKLLDLAEWCRHKYLSMTNEAPILNDRRRGIDDARQDVEEREWMSSPRCVSPPCDGDSIPINDLNGQGSSYSIPRRHATITAITPPHDDWHMSPINAHIAHTPPEDIQRGRSVVNVLMDKWKSLKGFKSAVHSILQGNTDGVFIFDPPSDTSENLFDLIHQYIDPAERPSITKAVLVACSTINMDLCRKPWNLTWWLSLFTATKWLDFQTRVKPAAVQKVFETEMSPDGMTLLANATVLLVGERFLTDLKATMLIARPNHTHNTRGDDDAVQRFREMSNECLSILMEFRTRGLIVDQSWYSYALDTL